jgi:hypothetical protein
MERLDDANVNKLSASAAFDIYGPVNSASHATNCEIHQPEPFTDFCDPVQAEVPHIRRLPVASDATGQFAVTQPSSLILRSPISPTSVWRTSEDRLSAAEPSGSRLFFTRPQELPSFSPLDSSSGQPQSIGAVTSKENGQSLLDDRQGPGLNTLHLSPVEERHPRTPTTRIRADSPTVDEFGGCHQAQSPVETPHKSPMRKQRLKAHNAAASTNATEVTMEVLAKFPMPPVPPLPIIIPETFRASIPSKLKQSKFPLA